MEDILTTIIGIALATIIMFIFPLLTMSDRTDDMSQLTVKIATSEFANDIRQAGKITPERYNRFLDNLNSTGNIYNITIEAKILDENPERKSIQTDGTLNESTYYSIYTTQIEDMISVSDDSIYNLDGKLILKQGDIVSVTVKNSSTTLSQELKGFYYKITGSDLNILVATETGVVAINGST